MKSTTKCGFDSSGGAAGSELLAQYGPTLIVDVGFDSTFSAALTNTPVPGISGINALVDTGASESCIDSMLAHHLNLPIIDRKKISGIGGQQEINMHLAQIHVPSIPFTIYGSFAGVHLCAGGQAHQVLIGRSFLRHVTMTYEGKTGTVTLSYEP